MTMIIISSFIGIGLGFIFKHLLENLEIND